MNISLTINVVADELCTDRFDPLGEGMTRRFISRGENIRPDGSRFISREDNLSYNMRILNAVSLTHEIEVCVDKLLSNLSLLNIDDDFSVSISIAAYHQDDQHIDVSLDLDLIGKLKSAGIAVDIEIYRFCPW